MRSLKAYTDLDELTDAVADLAISRILQGIDIRGNFHLALSGGEAGGLVASKLVSRWNMGADRFLGLHLWWGDERFLPAGSKDRNDTSVLEELKGNSAIHLHPVLASDSNVTLSVAARRYATDLTGIDMDLTLLGVGPDGHVASIFPDSLNKEMSADVVAISDAPKFPPLRVSFSMRKINASASVWLMASGTRKRDAVSRILANDLSIPATFAQGRVETVLFVDRDSLINE